jgi:hypothetical protein
MRCIATKKDGTPCHTGAMKDSDYCFFHGKDPHTGKQHRDYALTIAKEIEIVENALRGTRKARHSLDKARLVIQLVELLERLKKEGSGEVDIRSLTVEERLALRNKT